MRIALVQVASPPEEPIADRRRRVEAMVRTARGADLVVLPELWGVGYFSFDAYADEAEPLTGPTVTGLAEVARELACHVHVGTFVEDAGDGAVRNTAVLVGPDGNLLHSYSKIHVFGYQSREAELLEPGTSLGLSRTELGTIGSTTCYDLRFPELWRSLVDSDAESVVVPAAWPQARIDHWKLFTTARAVEQQVFVIACNAVGEQAGTVLGGHSRIVDPWGEIVVEAGTDEGVTWGEIDPDRVAEVRAQFPVLQNRLASYEHLGTVEAR